MNSSEAIRHTLRIGIWKRRWGRTPAAGVHKLETGFQSRCRLARNGQYAKGQTDEALASATEALEFANRTGVAYWKPKLCPASLEFGEPTSAGAGQPLRQPCGPERKLSGVGALFPSCRPGRLVRVGEFHTGVARILRTPQGERLRAIATTGVLSHRTARAIAGSAPTLPNRPHIEELAALRAWECLRFTISSAR